MSKENRESPRGRSQLSLYANCNRKWAFKYLKGWKVPEERYSPLHFGSTIHEMQEAFYKAEDNHMLSANRRKDQLLPPMNATDNLVIFRDKVDKTFRKWYDELGQKDIEEKTPMLVEQEMELTLPNGYVMTIRIDRAIQEPDGEIYINDSKTTGWSLDATLEKYMRHDQPKLYTAGFRQNYPELLDDFSGWRTDGIFSKKAPRSPGGYNIKIRRSPSVTFTEAEIDDVLMSYAGIVDDIMGKVPYVGQEPYRSLFPGNYGHCDAFNRRCEYSQICPFIDTQDEPPADLEIDPWLAAGTVLDSFKEQETSHENE